jgi:hypothetical protein
MYAIFSAYILHIVIGMLLFQYYAAIHVGFSRGMCTVFQGLNHLAI